MNELKKSRKAKGVKLLTKELMSEVLYNKIDIVIDQGRDSQILTIFITLSLKMSSLLGVISIFKVYMIKF